MRFQHTQVLLQCCQCGMLALQGESSGGMERTIDQDKVAAAQEVLDTTRASKARCAVCSMKRMNIHIVFLQMDTI